MKVGEKIFSSQGTYLIIHATKDLQKKAWKVLLGICFAKILSLLSCTRNKTRETQLWEREKKRVFMSMIQRIIRQGSLRLNYCSPKSKFHLQVRISRYFENEIGNPFDLREVNFWEKKIYIWYRAQLLKCQKYVTQRLPLNIKKYD